MVKSINLIHVLLPDCKTIISTSFASSSETSSLNIADLIYSILSDIANSASLYSVFGSNYDPSSVIKSHQDEGSWWLDANGMPWAIQTVEISEANRQWQQEELDNLGEGLLPLVASIFDKLKGTPFHLQESNYNDKQSIADEAAPPSLTFSKFALSSHLHTPQLRLVCGAPGLAVRLRFAHVPEITDGWEGRIFFLPAPWNGIGPASGIGTTATEAIEAICEELGIRRVILRGSKSARVEYALADVISDRIAVPPPPPLDSNTCLPDHIVNLLGPPLAYPHLYFTISATWLSRLGTVALGFSKHARKNVQPLSSKKSRGEIDPNGKGVMGLWELAINGSKARGPDLNPHTDEQQLESARQSAEIDDEFKLSRRNKISSEDENDTVKESDHIDEGKEKHSSYSAANVRLSKIFEGWLSSPSIEGNKKTQISLDEDSRSNRILSIGNPTPSSSSMSSFDCVSQSSSTSTSSEWSSPQEEDEEKLEENFEALICELGIKGNSRSTMLSLSDDRKRILISQNKTAKATRATKSKVLSPQNTGASTLELGEKTGVSGLSDTLSRASNALTWGNRFSIASITGWTGDESEKTISSTRANYPISQRVNNGAVSDGSQEAVKVQGTGSSVSIWNIWWSGSSTEAVEKDDPAYYPLMILNGKLSRKDLVKTLVSLRVTLSSAKLVWISAFLDECGLKAIESILHVETQSLTIPSSRHIEIKELSIVILSESIKCLRTLMNTESGFDRVLQNPHLINYITYSLRAPSYKLRSQVADLLAALCVLSSSHGHRMVCAALSELRIAADERYRFDILVESLSLEGDKLYQIGDVDEAIVWEYRASTLILINALANGPEVLEDRIALRDEFSRRGLNEVMVALGYVDPPDAIMTQIQVYNEERQDDLDDLHEVAMSAHLHFDSRYGEMYEILDKMQSEYTKRVMQVLRTLAQMVKQDMDDQFRSDLFHLVEVFVLRCSDITNFEESWDQSSRLFLTSVQHIIGKQIMIKASRLSDTSTIPSSVLEELEALRSKVEELSDERINLKLELSEYAAQVNTLRTLPGANTTLSGKRGASEAGPEVIVDHVYESQKEGESFGGIIQRLIQKEKQVLDLQKELDRYNGDNGISGMEEDETRAKRERLEKNRQWANLMEEIANLKEKMAEDQAVLEFRDKEIQYLKRALEAVYSRFQNGIGTVGSIQVSITSNQSSNVDSAKQQLDHSTLIDADTIANKTIEALGEKDAEIANLRSDVAKLQEEMIRSSQLQSSKKVEMEEKHVVAKEKDRTTIALLQKEVEQLQHQIDQMQKESQIDSKAVLHTEVASLYPPAPPPPPPPPIHSSISTMNFMPSPPPIQSPPQSLPSPEIASAVSLPILSRNLKNESAPTPPPPPPPPSQASPIPAPPIPPMAPGAPPPPPLPILNPIVSSPLFKSMMPNIHIPEKRRKPLFWNKLPAQVVLKTIWNDLPQDEIDVKLDDLDRLFAIENTVFEKVAPLEEKKTIASTTLIDLQRAQNVSIILSRIKFTFAQIRLSIQEVDDLLNFDQLKAIQKCLPNDEEAELIREYQGEFSSLSKADQFFKEMQGIPKVKDRMQCIIFMKKFEMDMEELKPDLKILCEAIKEVNGSKKFKLILKNVLMMGNILNNKTFRGEARGFVLSDLMKLRETRAILSPGHRGAIATPTLLHYLVQVLNRYDSTLIGFLDDCEHIEAAARINTAHLSASVAAVTSGLSMIKKEMSTLKKMNISSSRDQFIPICESFIKQATPQIDMLQEMHKQLTKDSSKMLAYFGESEKNAKIQDLFSLIGTFGQSLMKAEVEVKASEAKSAKEKIKAEPSNKNGSETSAPSPVVVNTTMLASVKEDTLNDSDEDDKSIAMIRQRSKDKFKGYGSLRGSCRYPSMKEVAIETLPEDAPLNCLDDQDSTLGKTTAIRLAGDRGQLDEALKVLRANGTVRKSFKRQEIRKHRPLSRVFLDS